MTHTAWGTARVIESVTLPQSVGEGREIAALVELLEGEDGASLVRFAYATDGVARRGPVTLRPADLVRLRKALRRTPRLEAALRAALA